MVPGFTLSPERNAATPGVDIAAPEGTPVLAALGGVVVASGFDAVYGNYVELTHENGLSTLYAQLSAREVEAGETVDQGQVIGTVGSTGTATAPTSILR